MRILWISARIFDDTDEKQSGVWQKALAVRLAEQNGIVLGNISYQSLEKGLIRTDYRNIMQWGIPRMGKSRRGMPPNKVRLLFEKAVNEFAPDIVQVWGSENPFKLLPFWKELPGVKVLTMQGVLGSIGQNIMKGLSFWEVISTVGLRELIKGSSLFSIRKSFIREGIVENKMIRAADFIITQSAWTESQIKPINPHAICFRTHRVLRDSFLECSKWNAFEHNGPVIYSASVGYSLKGLHILIRALAIVKNEFPGVELRLAGAVGRSDFLGDGYIRLIHRLIKQYNLERNITWLGAIAAPAIVENLQKASVFVTTSFVESYSLVVAEAMNVGTPSVISFAGAMPELANHNSEALFFTPGDYKQCAYQIIRLLSDKKFSSQMSERAIRRSCIRNVELDTVRAQMEIYQDILRRLTPAG